MLHCSNRPCRGFRNAQPEPDDRSLAADLAQRRQRVRAPDARRFRGLHRAASAKRATRTRTRARRRRALNPQQAWQDWVRVRRRFRAAVGAVLRHAAPAWQQLDRARGRPASRRCSRTSTKCSPTAGRWSGRSTTRWCGSFRRRASTSTTACARTSSSIRAPVTARASAASRKTPKSASHFRRATRCISSSSIRIPSRDRRSPT